MTFESAACTDIGNRKTTNQDSYSIQLAALGEAQVAFLVVCDGMGGLEKGELASAVLVCTLSEWFRTSFPKMLEEGFSYNRLKMEWLQLIQRQNLIMSDYGHEHNISLGTTVTAALFLGENYYACHVGDSRLYEIGDSVRQLTQDHTLVAQEVARGSITEEQAESHPQGNLLLQCVGASDIVIPDFLQGNIHTDKTYMLCSDGFRHKLKKTEIQEFLNPLALPDREAILRHTRILVDMDKERSEADNITVVLVKPLFTP